MPSLYRELKGADEEFPPISSQPSHTAPSRWCRTQTLFCIFGPLLVEPFQACTWCIPLFHAHINYSVAAPQLFCWVIVRRVSLPELHKQASISCCFSPSRASSGADRWKWLPAAGSCSDGWDYIYYILYSVWLTRSRRVSAALTGPEWGWDHYEWTVRLQRQDCTHCRHSCQDLCQEQLPTCKKVERC